MPESSQMREALRRGARIGSRSWFVYGVLFLAVLLAYVVSPVGQDSDSFLVAPTISDLLHHGTLRVDLLPNSALHGGYVWQQGADGGTRLQGQLLPTTLPAGTRLYDYFPWGGAILLVPLALGFIVLGKLGIGRFDFDAAVRSGDTGFFALVGGSLLTALLVVVVTATIHRLLAAHGVAHARRRAVLVGLVVAFGTACWSTLSRAAWSQTSATLLVAVALLFAVRLVTPGRGTARGSAFGMGLAIAAAYTCRPTVLVPMLVLAVFLVAVNRRRPAVVGCGLLGAVVIAVPWVVVNELVWGTVQPPYYSASRATFAPTFFEALAGNLVSPSRGLFVFSCVALAAVVGAVVALRRPTSVPVSIALVGIAVVVLHLVAVSGSSEGWWAGWAYGPRFMADTIPFLAVLAVPVVDGSLRVTRPVAVVLAVLVVVSVGMNAVGAVAKPAMCWNSSPVNVDDDPARVWSWSDPQWARPFVRLADTRSLHAALHEKCSIAPPA